MNIRESLERLGADEMAPEGSQAWTLAEVARHYAMLEEALHVAQEALESQDNAGSEARHALPQVKRVLQEVRS